MKYAKTILLSYLLLTYSCFVYGEPICYHTSGRFYNDCSDSSGFYVPKMARFLNVGNKSLMLINSNFKLMIFDLTTSPEKPSLVGDIIMPFPEECGLPFGCGDNHFQYEDTLYPVSVATLGGTGYAFAPLNGYGWDLLKIRVENSKIYFNWYNTGYHPPGSGGPYLYGLLFSDGVKLYLIGQMLDFGSVKSYDKSIRIYSLGSDPPLDLFNSMGNGTRIPIGKPEDGEPAGSAQLSMGKHKFFLTKVGNKRILMVHTKDLYPDDANYIAFFDITNPDRTQPAGFIPYSRDPMLFSSAIALEPENGRLWTAFQKGGSSATVQIYGYKLVENNGRIDPLMIFSGNWGLGSQSGAGLPILAAEYGILAFGWMQVGKILFIDSYGALKSLPDEPGYTDLSVNLEEPCQYWDLARGYTGLGIYNSEDGLYLYRGAMKEGRMIKISSECLGSISTDAGLDSSTDISDDTDALSDNRTGNDANDDTYFEDIVEENDGVLHSENTDASTMSDFKDMDVESMDEVGGEKNKTRDTPYRSDSNYSDEGTTSCSCNLIE